MSVRWSNLVARIIKRRPSCFRVDMRQHGSDGPYGRTSLLCSPPSYGSFVLVGLVVLAGFQRTGKTGSLRNIFLIWEY